MIKFWMAVHVNSKNSFFTCQSCETPFLFAAAKGKLQVVEYLAQNPKVDVKAKDIVNI